MPMLLPLAPPLARKACQNRNTSLMKDSNLSRAAGTVQRMDIHVLLLGHASILLFSIQLNICDCFCYFNAADIFLLEPKGRGGKELSGLF
jgi:hypothetical protein